MLRSLYNSRWFSPLVSLVILLAVITAWHIRPALALVMSVDRLLASAAAPPVLTSCGTTPAITGNDMAGTVTMGTGTPTGCVITFAAAYAVAPFCLVVWIATPLASQSYATSTTAITLTQTATSSNVVKYMCVGNAI